MVEILGCVKNEKIYKKKHSSFPKSVLKMQNFPVFGSENRKSETSLKPLIFLSFSMKIAYQKASLCKEHDTDVHLRCIQWKYDGIKCSGWILGPIYWVHYWSTPFLRIRFDICYHQSGQVLRENELSHRRSRTPDFQWSTLLLGKVALVY